jgi:hypothetical protein
VNVIGSLRVTENLDTKTVNKFSYYYEKKKEDPIIPITPEIPDNRKDPDDKPKPNPDPIPDDKPKPNPDPIPNDEPKPTPNIIDDPNVVIPDVEPPKRNKKKLYHNVRSTNC